MIFNRLDDACEQLHLRVNHVDPRDRGGSTFIARRIAPSRGVYIRDEKLAYG